MARLRQIPSRPIAVFLALTLIVLPVHTQLHAEEPATHGLRVLVVDGNGAYNRIGSKVRGPVVQVEDENKNPIPGVSVTFSLPAQGPGGAFDDGVQRVTVFTDSHGRAAAPNLIVNNIAGVMRIYANATLAGQSGVALISQTNLPGDVKGTSGFVADTQPRSTGGGKKKTLIIVALLAGGAAIAYFALSGNDTPGSVPVTAGAPSVSGPR